MSLRQKFLAARLSVGLEDHESTTDVAEAVQEAVSDVAEKIVEAAAEQAADAAEAAADGSEGGEVKETTTEIVAEGEQAEEAGEESEAADAEEATAEQEDAEGEQTAEEAEESDEDATLDSGAEEILEINAEGDEAEQEEEAVEEVAEIAGALESIALSMESSLELGGLTPMAAEGYHIAVEAYCSRVGLDNAVPSMESFGGSGTRVHYTQISVENIRERAGELWKALLEMLEKARAAMMEFLKKTFTMVGQIKAKAQSIAKAADGLSGTPTSQDLAGMGAKLTVGGKMPSDLAAELGKLGKVLEDAYSYADGAVAYATAINQGIAGLDAGSDEKFSAGVAAMIKEAAEKSPNFSPASEDYRGNEVGGVGMVGKQTATLLGEAKVISVRLGDANIDQAAALRGLGGQRNAVEIGKGEGEEKAAVLNADQIKAIAAQVVKIAEAVEGYKDTAAKVDKAIGDLTKVGRGFQRVAQKAETLSADNKKLVNPVVNVVKSVPAVVAQPATKLTQHSLSVCQGALKYCAASIKAYGKGLPATTEEATA